jgi:hypothetical protein
MYPIAWARALSVSIENLVDGDAAADDVNDAEALAYAPLNDIADAALRSASPARYAANLSDGGMGGAAYAPARKWWLR